MYRLNGLEPDNLLAFLTLLGLLRSLEAAQPSSIHRVAWTVDDPPIRPILHSSCLDRDSLLDNAAKGLGRLARAVDFNGRKDIALSPDEARTVLADARGTSYHLGSMWSALVSDAATSRDGRKVEPTPLCLMFGQGHQHFLARLEAVPKTAVPPPRGKGRRKTVLAEGDCLRETLFEPWRRPDATPSFRWDYCEDVRYALRATDPTDSKTKETTQHGANRLAAVGLATLTVVPQRSVGGTTRLALPGGRRDHGRFTFSWPIWRNPITLPSLLALLGHPALHDPDQRAVFGVVECRRATRVPNGKFMNVSRAEST